MVYKDILIGEYSNYFITVEGKLKTYDNNVLCQYSLPEPIKTGSAGHPWACLISEKGNVFVALGDNTQWKHVVSLLNAVSCASYFNHHVVVHENGSVTIFNDTMAMTALHVKGHIVKAAAADNLLLLDKDGKVWEYEWCRAPKAVKTIAELKALQPIQKTLTGPATDIGTSRSMFSGAIVNSRVFAWCDSYGAPFWGLTRATPNPIDVTDLIKLPEPAVKIFISDNTIHLLTPTANLYGLGNNWMGEVGNGEIHPAVLAGDANMANRQFVTKAVLIAKGVAKVFKGSYYGFRNALQYTGGAIAFWGYPKFGLLSTGIKPFDDPKNVGPAAITKPWRVAIPEKLTVVQTVDILKMIADGRYPPAQPRKLIKTVMYYDDGTEETQLA